MRNACLLMSLVLYFGVVNGEFQVFNLKNYGAIDGGSVDNSQALLKAWDDACKWKGERGAQVLIPLGTYLTKDVILTGPCRGPIRFRIIGVLKAPAGRTGLDHWINIRYVDRLTVDGQGTFDGQGQTVWAQPNSAQGRSYSNSALPSILSFAFVTNSRVRNIKLLNSKSTHFHIFGCDSLDINRIRIQAPEQSPNTDGIKIGVSRNIRISNSHIGSGDDCIALLTGSNNINITGIHCGPGHGISIGSLGSSPDDHVSQILVRKCMFTNTMNGVRIKTWATNNPGSVSYITFKDIAINSAYNPIVIDQNYCPLNNCPKGNSHVQIGNVKFTNVTGTSMTNAVVNLQCSGSNPCTNIELTDIRMTYVGRPKGLGFQACSNVEGGASGVQIPKSCF
ncbi:hypothetical protein Nepgr_015965 [Nepenthes gracilis]|uniref:Polygalacturonase n=1 Tax=Nepenthes gracilis TaxID=150966 RepID=A0AAD3SNW7_NEPGR|nr:hypothetical protein Nepgr_015965 [Nepenthes gracilis]